MKFEHLTTSENRKSILANGFDISKFGSNAGKQMCEAVYLTQHPQNWKHIIGLQATEDWVSLSVEVAMDNIVNFADVDQALVREWEIAEGYLTGEETHPDELPEKTQEIMEQVGYGPLPKYLTSLYLRAHGYAGYWYQQHPYQQLVVWDLSIVSIV